MKNVYVVCALVLSSLGVQGQKYVAEKSSVSFFSKAAIEDITAVNQGGSSIFNVETGQIAFSIAIRDFRFDKSLMQEHFNEKYMESDKFPKSTFQGLITGYDPRAAGMQETKASGKLAIHGVTRDIEAAGTVEFSGDRVTMKSRFIVRLEDYAVPRPQLLWKNIAEQVEVSLEFTYKPYEK